MLRIKEFNTLDSFLTCLFPCGCRAKITPMAKSYARKNPIQKKKWMTRKELKISGHVENGRIHTRDRKSVYDEFPVLL